MRTRWGARLSHFFMLQIAAILLLLCLALMRHARSTGSETCSSNSAKQPLQCAWYGCIPAAYPSVSESRVLASFFPLPIAPLFFVPALAVAMSNRKRFDRSGDGCVKAAAAAVDQLITFGIMGMAGMLVFTGWLWIRNQ